MTIQVACTSLAFLKHGSLIPVLKCRGGGLGWPQPDNCCRIEGVQFVYMHSWPEVLTACQRYALPIRCVRKLIQNCLMTDYWMDRANDRLLNWAEERI